MKKVQFQYLISIVDTIFKDPLCRPYIFNYIKGQYSRSSLTRESLFSIIELPTHLP